MIAGLSDQRHLATASRPAVDTGAVGAGGQWLAVDRRHVDAGPSNNSITCRRLGPIGGPASVPAPTPASVFIPGTWYYQQTRMWRQATGWSPRWAGCGFGTSVDSGGYVFLEGHWDLDLARRGMMFAPIYFTSPIYRRPSWFYRPTFVVQTDFLMGALFIRPGYSTYYFGDFFDASYRRRGFVSFVDFRFGRTGIDPLFGYYRWSNRAVPHWEADLRGVYTNRFNNVAVRPPRTLVQQTTVINNINPRTLQTFTRRRPWFL